MASAIELAEREHLSARINGGRMIRRQHTVSEFFEQADTMREVLDARFKDPYADSIPWYYFCDPGLYTYLRTSPEKVFPAPIFDRFMQRLRQWCMENLGLVPMNLPYLHLMVDGCTLGLHSDFHNGAWGYVYSLTRWEKRRFFGGETVLLRDGIPSYKKHHVHGEVLYELIPAEFNQLLVFDDRIVHATRTVEGSMDPLDGRIALVGHIRASSPVVDGGLDESVVRRVIREALPHLRDRMRSYRDVQGTITYRLGVSAVGAVESVATLTDNVVTAISGYDASDAVVSVKAILQQAMVGLQFPPAAGTSVLTVPLLLPLPDLRPIEIIVPHKSSRDAMMEYALKQLSGNQSSGLRGAWDGGTFIVREPIVGRIEFQDHRIAASFDAPMWVPSQRESFQRTLTDWANTAASSAQH